MAIFDTHKAYTALAAGGFTKAQAQTLIETLSESDGSLATKADLQALELALRSDLQALEQTTKADLRELELRVDARFDAVDAKLESLEQRMMIRLGAMLIAAVALIVTIQGVLLALFLNA